MPEVSLLLSDGSEYPEKGRVDAMGGIIDKQTGAVSIRAVFPNPEGILRSGGQGNVLLPTEKKGCIVIPQAATTPRRRRSRKRMRRCPMTGA